jgi:hypothetical protein
MAALSLLFYLLKKRSQQARLPLSSVAMTSCHYALDSVSATAAAQITTPNAILFQTSAML